MSEDYYGPDAATFGDRLAAARDAAGLSQDQLAKHLGVKLKTLKAWENDLSEPRANRLQMLAGMLNVSMMWLLSGNGDGLDAPDSAATLPDEVSGLLTELREIRAHMAVQSERLGRLEKRLRTALKETAQ